MTDFNWDYSLIQDAHEFLSQVLDQLKEEVAKVMKSTPSPNRSPREVTEAVDLINPTLQNFEFEVTHTISCSKYGNLSFIMLILHYFYFPSNSCQNHTFNKEKAAFVCLNVKYHPWWYTDVPEKLFVPMILIKNVKIRGKITSNSRKCPSFSQFILRWTMWLPLAL